MNKRNALIALPALSLALAAPLALHAQTAAFPAKPTRLFMPAGTPEATVQASDARIA